MFRRGFPFFRFFLFDPSFFHFWMIGTEWEWESEEEEPEEEEEEEEAEEEEEEEEAEEEEEEEEDEDEELDDAGADAEAEAEDEPDDEWDSSGSGVGVGAMSSGSGFSGLIASMRQVARQSLTFTNPISAMQLKRHTPSALVGSARTYPRTSTVFFTIIRTLTSFFSYLFYL
jgi:hypothetical protein